MDTTEHDKAIAAAHYKFRMVGQLRGPDGRRIEPVGDELGLRFGEYQDAIKAKENALKEYKESHKGRRSEILAQIAALLTLLEYAD